MGEEQEAPACWLRAALLAPDTEKDQASLNTHSPLLKNARALPESSPERPRTAGPSTNREKEQEDREALAEQSQCQGCKTPS
jgi:hypothetical protein